MNGQQALSRDAERVVLRERALAEERARRDRFDKARGRVESFAPFPLTDLAAMALIQLERHGMPVTKTAVRERVVGAYPWVVFE